MGLYRDYLMIIEKKRETTIYFVWKLLMIISARLCLNHGDLVDQNLGGSFAGAVWF